MHVVIQLRCDSVIVVTVNNIFLEKVLQQIIDIVAFELKPICAGQIEHTLLLGAIVLIGMKYEL